MEMARESVLCAGEALSQSAVLELAADHPDLNLLGFALFLYLHCSHCIILMSTKWMPSSGCQIHILWDRIEDAFSVPI